MKKIIIIFLIVFFISIYASENNAFTKYKDIEEEKKSDTLKDTISVVEDTVKINKKNSINDTIVEEKNIEKKEEISNNKNITKDTKNENSVEYRAMYELGKNEAKKILDSQFLIMKILGTAKVENSSWYMENYRDMSVMEQDAFKKGFNKEVEKEKTWSTLHLGLIGISCILSIPVIKLFI